MQNIPQRLPSATLLAVAVLGCFAAVALGVAVGSGSILVLPGLVGLSAVALVVLGMKQHIWMLIPACWMLTGRVAVLPFALSVRELAIILAGSVFFVMVVLKQVRQRQYFGVVDVLLWINVALLFTVFLRNPVGVNMLGSQLVGGKPYFNVALALLSYFILSRNFVQSDRANIIPVLVVGASFVIGLLGVLSAYFPSVGNIVFPFYTGVDLREEGVSGSFGSARITALGSFGMTGALALVSVWKPETLVNPVYVGRFLLFLGTMASVFISGFRSILFTVMCYFALSAYLRDRVAGLVKTGTPALAVLIILISLQGNFIDLPQPAQRALSWLPGNWSQQAKESGTQSTEWRFEMWRLALTEPQYIRNKVFGDGFGFTRQELTLSMEQKRTGRAYVGGGGQHEAFLTSGSFHSGPVSTIKAIGYVGLPVFITLTIFVAWFAYRLAVAAQGTSFFIPSLFISIQAIYYPLNFVFIFGDFRHDLPQIIFLIGMLKLLHLSMVKAGILESTAGVVKKKA